MINIVKLLDTTTKIGIKFFRDAAKTASKRVVQKIAEVTDLIGNKIADKITSVGKSKKVEEIYIPPEKDNKLLMILNCFGHKM